MNLYLVRHGSTGAYEVGRRQSPQTPLSKEGRLEAKKAATWLVDKKIKVVLSSPWARTRQTAEIMAKKLNKQIEFLDILHEKAHHPDLYGAKFEDEIHQQWVEEYVENKENYDWKLMGKGESIREMLQRGVDFKEILLEKYMDETLVVVSHAYFIQGFVSLCLRGENFDTREFKKRFRTVSVDNGSISLMEKDKKKSPWKAVFLNLRPGN